MQPSESAGLELIGCMGINLHALWAPTVSGKEHITLVASGSSPSACERAETVIRTRLLQRLCVPHQPGHRLGVPVEDLQGQVVVLLLLHYSLLKLLLVTRHSPSTPVAYLLPVAAATDTHLAHDGELQRQVLHLHKVFFVRLLTGAAGSDLLKRGDGEVTPEAADEGVPERVLPLR